MALGGGSATVSGLLSQSRLASATTMASSLAAPYRIFFGPRLQPQASPTARCSLRRLQWGYRLVSAVPCTCALPPRLIGAVSVTWVFPCALLVPYPLPSHGLMPPYRCALAFCPPHCLRRLVMVLHPHSVLCRPRCSFHTLLQRLVIYTGERAAGAAVLARWTVRVVPPL